MKTVITLILIVINGFLSLAQAQEVLTGKILANENGKEKPLAYASVRWMNTTFGAVANGDGVFSIKRVSESKTLIVSYTGYIADTIFIDQQSEIRVVLLTNNQLNEAIVREEGKATTIGSISNMKTEVLGKGELKKAACCNLSESFETNPTIEASYADALTGIRQIQMLGLSGVYAQTMIENMPMIHGLNAGTGLSFIPGPFVESIYLSKGVGSVSYGYESMSGQINIELLKPESTGKLFLNGYQNIFGRSELNVITAKRINKSWSTSLLAHGSNTQNNADPNKDGFLNMASGNGVNLINRWKYQGENWEGMIGVRFVNEARVSGQKGYTRGMQRDSISPFGVEYATRQSGVWAKFGRMASEEKQTSIGFIVNANRYENDFIAGLKNYNGVQNSLYASMVFNRNLKGSDKHVLSGGVNVLADDYTENYMANEFKRTEIVPGIFSEYTFKYSEKFSAVMGARADYHNLFGAFFTPRLHLRFAPSNRHVFRASAGRGQRTANVFTENMGIFVSSRELVSDGIGYTQKNGLQPEVSWNYGGNYTYTMALSSSRTAQFSFDYYYVHFVNQAVIDTDSSSRAIYIYNLRGLSYSHTMQAQVIFEPIDRMEVRMAYRYLDVRTTYTTGLREKSLLAPHRGFFNIAYTTKKKWAFDLTAQFNGRKRLPDLMETPEEKRLRPISEAYTIVNAQVSKTFGDWEIYLGGENLLNTMQRDLIVDAQNPYGPYFDASMVWGPAMGAMAYIGFRYDLK